MKLYIIGNGFDLAHNLPSHYSDFAAFCKEKDSFFYKSMNDLFPKLTPTEEKLWSNFEEGLGEPDLKYLDRFYNNYINNPGNDGFLKIFYDIKNYFKEWVISLKEKTLGLKPIYDLDKNSIFLSFNYTDTLETVYKISSGKILHIHGYEDDVQAESFFVGYIFGHGREKLMQTSHIDSREYLYNDFVNGFRKDYQIDEISSFLRNFPTIEEIIVYGHSMNKIDNPYFEIIKNQYPEAKWNIEYHIKYCKDKEGKESNIHRLQIDNYKLIKSIS